MVIFYTIDDISKAVHGQIMNKSHWTDLFVKGIQVSLKFLSTEQRILTVTFGKQAFGFMV